MGGMITETALAESLGIASTKRRDLFAVLRGQGLKSEKKKHGAGFRFEYPEEKARAWINANGMDLVARAKADPPADGEPREVEAPDLVDPETGEMLSPGDDPPIELEPEPAEPTIAELRADIEEEPATYPDRSLAAKLKAAKKAHATALSEFQAASIASGNPAIRVLIANLKRETTQLHEVVSRCSRECQAIERAILASRERAAEAKRTAAKR